MSPSVPPLRKEKPGRLRGQLFLRLICSSFRAIPLSYDLHSLFPNSSAFNLIPFTHTPVSFLLFFFFFPCFLLASLLAALQTEKLNVSLTPGPGLSVDGDWYKLSIIFVYLPLHNVFAALYYSNTPGGLMMDQDLANRLSRYCFFLI